MITIGGSIGTGLFMVSGSTIYKAGPGGALLAYILIGILVYIVTASLGEMATYMPTSGAFSSYSSKFIDPAIGFAVGWNYWFSWTTTLAAEMTAGAILMRYWFPNSHSLLWSLLFIFCIFLINLLSVKYYGETEYWLAIIKIITVIIFICLGLSMSFGIIGNTPSGFQNFFIEDAPFSGGALSILGVFIIAGYSFQGTETIGIMSGESRNPRRDIPKAIRKVFWRIFIFYVLTIGVIGLSIPYTNPNLVNEDIQNFAMSPFTLVFEQSGFTMAASIMNIVILTSIFSAGNSGMYASTRLLWKMSTEGTAPEILSKINKKGVPIFALLLTTITTMSVFLLSLIGEGKGFFWLLSASGLCGFIAWITILVSHYRFRKAFLQQGNVLSELSYYSKWYPNGVLIAIGTCVCIILGQNYTEFFSNRIDWYSIFATYIGIPIFVLLWAVYKIIKKTKVVRIKNINLKEGKI
ncbi:amino acid permease [Bacillus thuringiensis]|uniref:amino acid permease n=1 Tax=Bacillus thuringiensis TaxID=1428 RepID=UPI0025A5A3EC|nr:amino acid permease [Bacillus thuringiensis]MDM8365621.1 amino acid permease [Bacillus thuringiensis]